MNRKPSRALDFLNKHGMLILAILSGGGIVFILMCEDLGWLPLKGM